MIKGLLHTELLKTNKLIWVLFLIGPLLVLGMQVLNYAARYDYLLSRRPDAWHYFIENVQVFWPPALLLGMSLTASLMANVEYRADMWKKMFSLPIQPSQAYLAKTILLCAMLILSGAILYGGTLLLGGALGFDGQLPYTYALKMSYGTLFAAMPFAALQFWLSMHHKNQGIALTVGIAGAALAMFADQLPWWIPWTWPLLLDGIDNSLATVLRGVAVGLVLWIAAICFLAKKEVK